MSSHEQAVVSLLSNIALSIDGAAVLGLTLAYAAARTIVKFTSSSSALRKLQDAPSVLASDLRSMLDVEGGSDSSSRSEREVFVIVRGSVMAKWAAEGGKCGSLRENVLFSHISGDRAAVIIQRTQTCIYNGWKRFFGWTSDLLAILSRSLRERKSSSLRTVPFVLLNGSPVPVGNYVVVNMDGSKHHLPLTTVYRQLQPINASPCTFLQALFGHEYPVGLLDEEKILPIAKYVTAVGHCFLKDGIPEIKSCNDLPYFLTEMAKDQMVIVLAFRTKILFWTSIFLGLASIGILGFAFVRNWYRWKEWRQRRRHERLQQSRAAVDEPNTPIAEDESEDVPDGQLCAICLVRRRRSAFVPCGHLVCCHLCALSVEREVSPKCTVCRQTIFNSVRIYNS
ncbi:E3 ubiquitin-protein ligase SPL2-like [Syzygium oleosum]|uniref:E3 ubiquitin-protein ligase SPL2-like n=1 Tax=Syzygium oleosum TaxID=219896 RepID=UPI0024B8CF8A|nr:E3 ubiquitin-protein ligase SPL2-like [Syzygium oleosum]